MFKRLFSVLVFCGLLYACSEPLPELPLPEDQVLEILIDTHVAEAALKNVYGIRKDSLAKIYYDELYTIHKIDEATLKEILLALRKDPQKMERLYDKMMVQIAEMEKQQQ